VKFSLGIELAVYARIRQLVFAGLATTSDLQFLLATSLSASPYTLKISPLVLSKSLRSMPGLRGNPPMKTQTSTSLNKILGSEPEDTACSNGYAPSSISRMIPSRIDSA
jgi:hypothetical protein